ncbi:heavy-metal-associated domain-containing protein [Daejeonella sp. H1SJ63]|jgi:copper chaperone CopZ|uniref:heavy-metal-associated domain-containing protein n=1 Tax=Daejeonella sp. H1SJ63 TaxID=3034145 RepID=UPI0023EB261D|nr:heavy-metal-associated domain-containing protein [Daejeonella sp. H1SJ63]
MNTIKFKTNIKCTGCLTQVGPSLNETAGQDNWQVDLSSTDKILTVNTDLNAGEIIDAVKKAGYTAEKI